VLKGVDRTGRNPGDIDICGCAWFSLSSDGKGTVTDSLKEIVAYFGPYLEDATLATVGLNHADFDPIKKRIDAQDYTAARDAVTAEMLRLAVVGSPHDAIRKIELLAKAGITQVSVGGPLGPDPRETIRLFGEHIIPYFRN
jgi:5,10-methylenetetrahydromethanopterin reductase